MKHPILITGCARSGTSLTAGTIDACGAWGGNICGATRANKKGQFENREIVDKVIKPYLTALGYDPMGQCPLPDTSKLLPFSNIKDSILSILRKQGLKNQQWYFKGAKMCLLWPVFNAAFPTAKWVIPRRSTDQIVDSCLRTPFMRAFKDRKGWSEWVDHHIKCFNEMKEAGLDIIEVHPELAVKGNLSEMEDMIGKLGLIWNRADVVDFITPALWNRGIL